eukprot:362597-Lingulodinium_polyedra.AAC.1
MGQLLRRSSNCPARLPAAIRNWQMMPEISRWKTPGGRTTGVYRTTPLAHNAMNNVFARRRPL